MRVPRRENEACLFAELHVNALLTRLEIATQPWHRVVDSTWQRLRRPDVTRADYVESLLKAYGYIAPIESACMYAPELERWLGDRPLVRAGMIAQDLVSLGMLPSLITRIPQCPDITTFRTAAEALGWLYLIERGATVRDGLRGHLVEMIPNLEYGCSFLAVTEERAQERFARFRETVERIATTYAIADELVAAACEAFSCAHSWTLGIATEQRSAS